VSRLLETKCHPLVLQRFVSDVHHKIPETKGLMVGPTGFEPSPECASNSVNKGVQENEDSQCPPPRSPEIGTLNPELAQLVKTWDKIPEHIRGAIQTMIAPYTIE